MQNMTNTNLKKFEQIMKQKAEIEEKLKKLQSDEKVQKAINFREKLVNLMEEFEYQKEDVLAILGYETKKVRKRKVSTYINPETGEKIVTGSGNHKILKEWKQKYGPETVESWRQ
jgi:CRISPR/Cas system Type II protein with McrA/HNH and RuvC-like nuclease domain